MDLRTWQSLAEPLHEELIRLASATDAGDVAAVSRLRKVCPDAEIVRAAIMLAEARRKAVPKFGVERSAELWADPQGVEMASSLMAARHKASRVARVVGPGAVVHDLCCGIGGDSIAMAEAGMAVVPVDIDPVRAWMAGRNCGRAGVCEDVGEFDGAAAAAHIDPARRSESGTRSWSIADLRPGPEILSRVIERIGEVAVKLGPGVDAGDLPVEWSRRGLEVEYISENGRLTQAVVWTGRLAGREGVGRAATLLSGGGLITLRGEAGEAPIGATGRYIHEPDDAVERAGLLGVLCGQTDAVLIHPKLGLLTTGGVIQSPWLTPFEVLAEMPWSEKRVKGVLEGLHAGIVEVKTRGKAVNPDEVQVSLRGKGDQPLVVFVLRFDRELRAIIARRV